MGNVHSVDFGLTRELLAQIDSVRALVLTGQVQGWTGSVLMADGSEKPYVAGLFATDRDAMLKAAMRHSMARMKSEDPPLRTG